MGLHRQFCTGPRNKRKKIAPSRLRRREGALGYRFGVRRNHVTGNGCGSVPVSIEYPILAKKLLSCCEHSVNFIPPDHFVRTVPHFSRFIGIYFAFAPVPARGWRMARPETTPPFLHFTTGFYQKCIRQKSRARRPADAVCGAPCLCRPAGGAPLFSPCCPGARLPCSGPPRRWPAC